MTPQVGAAEHNEISRDEISQELSRVLGSSCFAKSPRLRRFLEYVVGCVESGELNQIREYNIALEVFQRRPTFDQRLDPIVRVEASRLRGKLTTYYETEGKGSPLVIELPRGTYVPTVHLRSEPARGADSGQPEDEPDTNEDVEVAPSARARERRSGWFAVALGLGLALLVINGFALWQRRSGADAQSEPVRVTSDSGVTAYPALSADGKLLAYSSDRGGQGSLSIWIQALSGGPPTRLTRGPHDDREPSFSPDGAEIVFRSEVDGGGIYSVSVFGGSKPQLIVRDGHRPRYSPDGTRILYWNADEDWTGGQIYVVSAQGGTPRLLTPGFEDAHYPVWSPDGRYVLFCGSRKSEQSASAYDWWVVPSNGGPAEATGAAESFTRYFNHTSRHFHPDLPNPAAWVDQGIIFSAHRNAGEHLYLAAITPGTFQIAAPPRQLTHSTGFHMQPAAGGGRLAFVSGRVSSGIWSLPIDRAAGRATGPATKLTFNLNDSAPSLSKDGRVLAYVSRPTEGYRLSIRDLRAGTEWVLDTMQEIQRSALISPDGSRAAYRAADGHLRTVHLVPTAGRENEKVYEDYGRPTSWSPDGRYILVEPRTNVPFLSAFEVATGNRFDVAKDAEEGIHSGTFSPDGRWIAFHTREQGQPPRLYVAPFRTGQTATRRSWIELTTGHNPAWSPDGRLLYFLCERDGFRCIWAQRLHLDTRQPEGEPFPVHHCHAIEHSLMVNVRRSPAEVGLTATGDKLVFAMDEVSGNVWMLPLQGGQ